jgi:hypothetical protein
MLRGKKYSLNLPFFIKIRNSKARGRKLLEQEYENLAG